MHYYLTRVLKHVNIVNVNNCIVYVLLFFYISVTQFHHIHVDRVGYLYDVRNNEPKIKLKHYFQR